MAEVSLLIEGQVFKANKEVLCKHSDYFRAMFSGSYVENDKQEISIHVVDAESMKIILKYMDTCSIDLKEYPIDVVDKLETAVKFLLITEFIKEIEYFLLSREMISVAQDPMSNEACATQIERGCAKYGLVPFKHMKTEYIPDITKLSWYLSHPYLDALCEADVFIFGQDWISQNKTGDDAREALLLVLGSLDIMALTRSDLSTIKTYMIPYQNSLAADIVNYLYELKTCWSNLSVDLITSAEIECSENVYSETLSLVAKNKRRCHEYTLVVTVVKIDKLELYKVTEKGFDKWLELPGFLQFVFVVQWRFTKMVMIKENDKSVWVFDVLKEEWTCHGKGVWKGCHDAACVVDDSLFLISFSSESRAFSTTIYDLKARVFVATAKISPPTSFETYRVSLCVHEGAIYAAIDGIVYKRDTLGPEDTWSEVDIQGRIHLMVSFKGYIYITMDGVVPTYRFRPGVDRKLDRLEAPLRQLAVHICNLGDRIFYVCAQPGWFIRGTRIDEYRGNSTKERIKEVHVNREIEIENVISCCPLLMDIPVYTDVSDYVKEHLKKYEVVL